MSIILSVSVEKRQAEFIRDAKVSASAILQRAINEMMERNQVSPQYVKNLQENMKLLQNVIQKQGEFINKNGLMDNYLKENV